MAVAVCLGGATGLLAQDRPAPDGPEPARGLRGEATQSLLDDLGRLFRGRSEAAGSAANPVDPVDDLTGGDERARRTLLRITGNADRLRLRDVRLDADGRPEPAGDGWAQDVRVTWRLGGVEERTTTGKARLVLRPGRGGILFAGVESRPTVLAPDWVTGTVHAERAGRVLALAPTTGTARTLLARARAAARTVRRGLPHWHGNLVVEAPRGPESFRQAAGAATQEAAAALAAVTGTGSAHAPVHVFVNEPVLATLGPLAQEIVLGHEAAHVALGAVTSTMPAWLVEGMADQVALAHVDLPDEVLAAQAASLVRERGLPRRLPRSSALDPAAPDAGAWYEASWLAVRDLVRRHGLSAVLRFYRASDRDGSTRGHFRAELGTSRVRAVADWRQVLRDLAAGSGSSPSQARVPG